MKRQLMFGTMLSAALAVGVAAQQPPAGGSTGASPQPPAGDRQAQAMTVTGCLQAANDAAGGTAAGAPTPDKPGAQAAAGGFVLTNVTPAGSMAGGATSPGAKTPGSATGTTGGATGTAGTTAGTRYRLTGGDNLQQYVGQKVEVTGSIAGGAGSSSSSTAPGAAGSTPGAAGSTPGAAASSSRGQDGQALRVASVRPTGEKCSQ